MYCGCIDWQENIGKVNAGFTMMFIHGCSGYDGKPFQYCPWCGMELIDD
jgi:hypothetical protein